MVPYRLLYSETSRQQIAALHSKIKSVVRSRLDMLQLSPFVGKRLEKHLAGYRSLRVRRFRIIHRVDAENKTLEIHYVGHRKDVYELLWERSGGLLAFDA